MRYTAWLVRKLTFAGLKAPSVAACLFLVVVGLIGQMSASGISQMLRPSAETQAGRTMGNHSMVYAADNDTSILATRDVCGYVSPVNGAVVHCSFPDIEPDNLVTNYSISMEESAPGELALDLLEGRMPTRAGEVAISSELRQHLPQRTIEKARDGWSVSVVGVVHSALQPRAHFLYAYPGTGSQWAEMRNTKHPTNPSVRAFISVRSDAPMTERDINDLLIAAASRQGGAPDVQTRSTLRDLSGRLAQSATTRTSLENQGGHALTERYPAIGWGFFVPLHVLLGAFLVLMFLRRSADRLGDLHRAGLDTHRLALGALLALSALIVALSAVLCPAIAWLTSEAAVRSMGDRLEAPINHDIDVVPDILTGACSAIGGAWLSFLAARRGHTQSSRLATWRARLALWGAWPRRGLALVALTVGATQLAQLDGMLAAGILGSAWVLAVALLAPDLSTLVTRVLPTRHGLTYVVRRRLQTHASLLTTCVMMLTFAVGLPLSVAQTVAAQSALRDKSSVDQPQEGRLVVEALSGQTDPAVSREITAALHQQPTVVSLVTSDGQELRALTKRQGSSLISVADGAALASLVSDPKLQEQAHRLDQYGMAVLSDSSARGTEAVQLTRDHFEPLGASLQLPTIRGDSYTLNHLGSVVITHAKAREMGFKVASEHAYVFTATADQAKAAVAQVTARGLEIRGIASGHNKMPPPKLPLVFFLVAGLVVALAVAISLGALRQHLKRATDSNRQLLVIGIAPRRLAALLGIEVLVAILPALLAGCAVAAVPGIATSLLVTYEPIDYPWVTAAAMMSIVVLAGVLLIPREMRALRHVRR